VIIREEKMRTNSEGVLRITWLVACVILADATLVWAQGALGTFNGRVLDQGDAVLPGVTVTATNSGTNVARTTVTNAEGLYILPALEPGIYSVQAGLSGFASSTQTGVTLGVNQTITIDIKLGLAGVAENITVTGASPLIEVTQSLVSATIRTREVVNLPLLTRSMSGLLALIPGSKPVAIIHPLKRNNGSTAFGGSTGRNVVPVVDGGDNRDNIVGGALLLYTVEGIEEFQVASHQFTAADGRSSGAAVNVLTKSGTNAVKGSVFLLDRDRSMTAKDYFTRVNNLPKLPFSRQQFGGSVGGPIVSNRAFFFGALERIREETAISIPNNVYKELQLLAFANPLLPEGQAINKPYRELLYTAKTNVQLSPNHSLIGRFYNQKQAQVNGGNGPTTDSYRAGRFQQVDMRHPNTEDQSGWDAVGQHSWTLGSRALNQFTVHAIRYNAQVDWGHFRRDYPNVPRSPDVENLDFPTVTIGNTATSYEHIQNMGQIKDSVTLQVGSHGLKMGGDYSWMPGFGGQCCVYFGQFKFFDDPSTILNNSNGKYPQGFQTPGIVQQFRAGADIKGNRYQLLGTSQVKAYVQDDWRVRRNLTLNLGVRYDVDRNFYDQDGDLSHNLTNQVLSAIGSPYAGLPHTPRKDISPRVGFAYDVRGDGRRVLRGGYGLYFDGTGINTHYNVFIQNHRPVSFDKFLANTAIGKGDLPTYRFGIDPPPSTPPAVTEFPGAFPKGSGAGGYQIDPNITDPRTHQFHLGYSHELAPSTVLSADYTHALGLNDFKEVQINTFKDGVRRLAPDLERVYGDPNLLSSVQLQSSIGRSQYDELAVQFQRRLPRATLQVNYILSGAYAYGGQIAQSAYFVPAAQDNDCIFCPGEWGPTPADERHRVVVFSVIDLPFGFQVSPVFQAATPRPYNLIDGTDLNADGQTLNALSYDRYIDPATGQQVSYNSQRGDPFVLFDARVTKYFTVGQENRKLGVFVEFFNLFNTANFGQVYNGNSRSVLFKQPSALLPGAGYPFQIQLGARFDF
jgi:carboxypeptidase family protein/TonB-dependent receptor-like protein